MTAFLGGTLLWSWVKLKRKTCARVVLEKVARANTAFVPPCRSTVPTRPISLPSCFIQERKEHEGQREREGGRWVHVLVELCAQCPTKIHIIISPMHSYSRTSLPNVKWFSFVKLYLSPSLYVCSQMYFTCIIALLGLKLSCFTIVEIKEKENKAIRQSDHYRVFLDLNQCTLIRYVNCRDEKLRLKAEITIEYMRSWMSLHSLLSSHNYVFLKAWILLPVEMHK